MTTRAQMLKWQANNADKVKVYRQRWNAKHKFYQRTWVLKKKYGLTREAYKRLLDDADYRCQICMDDTDLCVDHDHITGKVRGVLCRGCNLAIANARESKVILRNAISYLERLF